MQVIWDIETYPNLFLCGFKLINGRIIQYEISQRRNDFPHLVADLKRLSLMIGFNNVGFDYPVLHHLVNCGMYEPMTPALWYPKVEMIIHGEDRFEHNVRERDMIVPQLDLYLINHYDNRAKSTSLKMLECRMRSMNVADLPIEPGTVLTPAQIDVIKEYNKHDLEETEKFFHLNAESIEFRRSLGPSFTNYNDTKIGKQIFIERIGRRLCYNQDGSPRQTPRASGIRLADIILPYVVFTRPEFQMLLDDLKTWTITNTKGGFRYSIGDQEFKRDELSVNIDGFKYYLGTGGIHGSINNEVVTPADDEILLDIDAVSYYPSLAIANGFYPEHLGNRFCEVYSDVKTERLKHKKGSTENAALKLSLNGVYGDSNNPYSPFYDPQYTMSITINGQLLLCMFAEWITGIARVVQINTDGITLLFKRVNLPRIKFLCEHWTRLTQGIDLETVEYNAMWIRDVNNYVARTTVGKLKIKGAYQFEKLEWHKDHSALVIPRAAVAAMTEGANLETYIRQHPDGFDFLLHTRATRGSRLALSDGTLLSKTVRYYVARDGHELIKIMPPLKGKTAERHIKIHKGRKVRVCNTISPDFRLTDLDVDYYVKEARKLIVGV